MTTTEVNAKAFMAALCEDPFDEAARLVFADFLEEHDDWAYAAILRAGKIPMSKLDRNAAVALSVGAGIMYKTGYVARNVKRVIRELAATAIDENCSVCAGKGYPFLPEQPCKRCRGSGKYPPWLNPMKWCKLWILVHQARYTLLNDSIRKAAAERHERCARLVRIHNGLGAIPAWSWQRSLLREDVDETDSSIPAPHEGDADG
jgi:uncharacterized protein (TIGR02996 family)